MAAKPELSAAPGIQNVVVYVSNDNFAQAYAVGQSQNVAQGPHPIVQNGTYPPPHSMAPVGPAKCYIDKVKSVSEYQQGGFFSKVRGDECDYLETGCVVMGGEGAQSVRCDSVRSEAAESSCSSLSSTDEGLVVVPQAPDMVVYDNSSVSVRHGGVMLTMGPNGGGGVGGQSQTQGSASIVGTIAAVQQPPVVTVPFGWKRISSDGTIIYIR